MEVADTAALVYCPHPLLPAAGATVKALLARAQALHDALPPVTPSFAYGDFKADHL